MNMSELTKIDIGVLLATGFGMLSTGIIAVFRNDNPFFGGWIFALGLWIIIYVILKRNKRKNHKST